MADWISTRLRATRSSMGASRACGLDIGKVRVGVALEDELGLYAHPRGTLDGRDRRALVRSLAELAQTEQVTKFVIGLPLDMRGGEGESARKARAIAQTIADATGREVVLWDERLTTVQAKQVLAANELTERGMKTKIDTASAVLILQSWLDAKRPNRAR